MGTSYGLFHLHVLCAPPPPFIRPSIFLSILSISTSHYENCYYIQVAQLSRVYNRTLVGVIAVCVF